ncbi:MAG: DUF4012 domain-containing protein, partial [Actinomycetota bacterium]|nr:DUF4012 domain-containing protein [Actinomycetota bacterium]
AESRAGGLVVAPLQALPVAGRQVRSLAALAGAGEGVTGLGAAASASAQDLLRQPAVAAERLTTLDRVRHLLATTGRALSGVDLGPDGRHLLAPLARRRLELSQRLDEAGAALARGAATVDALARVLGGNRRYLFLAANNAEMRAGSGMFLEAGILDVRQGALALGPLRPTAELGLPGEGVPVEGDLAGRWGWLHPGREWRNLGASPRFEQTAALAARMWAARTGDHVDGVLAVDVEALRAVLSATGPVSPDGAPVSAATVVDRLLHDQYVDFADDHTARRDQLGQIASAALAALERGSYDVGRLVVELAGAARGRHLLAWAADRRDQEGWLAAGVGGAMEPDSLLVSVLNRGGNKLDRFLEVSNRVESTTVAAGRAVAVHVRLRNVTPPSQPTYVAGPHPESGVGEGVYLGIVAVNVPGAAGAVGVEGDPPLVAAGEDGPTRVVATPVVVPRGTERAVVVRFVLPARAVVRVEPSARLPASTWQHGTARWRDDRARVLVW